MPRREVILSNCTRSWRPSADYESSRGQGAPATVGASARRERRSPPRFGHARIKHEDIARISPCERARGGCFRRKVLDAAGAAVPLRWSARCRSVARRCGPRTHLSYKRTSWNGGYGDQSQGMRCGSGPEVMEVGFRPTTVNASRRSPQGE